MIAEPRQRHKVEYRDSEVDVIDWRWPDEWGAWIRRLQPCLDAPGELLHAASGGTARKAQMVAHSLAQGVYVRPSGAWRLLVYRHRILAVCVDPLDPGYDYTWDWLP